MADITVKLFGVFRSDTRIGTTELKADTVADIFPVLDKKADAVFLENKKADESLVKPAPIKFKDALVYINGEKCSKKGQKLQTGDEVWIMSPASGG